MYLQRSLFILVFLVICFYSISKAHWILSTIPESPPWHVTIALIFIFPALAAICLGWLQFSAFVFHRIRFLHHLAGNFYVLLTLILSVPSAAFICGYKFFIEPSANLCYISIFILQISLWKHTRSAVSALLNADWALHIENMCKSYTLMCLSVLTLEANFTTTIAFLWPFILIATELLLQKGLRKYLLSAFFPIQQ